ncbi:MAG: L,D-transpeptidase family protein [Acidobacteriota bacterium]
MLRELSLRPAAGFRRRPLLWALPLAFALATSGCGSRPAVEDTGARGAARKAIRLLRPWAPLKARYIEQLVADAEVASAAEVHAPWWAPQTGRGGAAWLRVARAAAREARAFRDRRAGAQDRYHELLTSARDEIARARAELREAGMGRREAAAMERATTLYLTAQKLASASDFERAADKLKGARELCSIVHHEWAALHARFGDAQLRRQWSRWADQTIEGSRDRGDMAIIIDKLRRRLFLYYRGLRLTSFPAELGANGLRRKEHAGDRATPEGMYRVVQMKAGHATQYYKALLINYPNDDDRQRFDQGKRRGTIPHRAGIGSLIEIHGEGGQGRDWTDGCVALRNEDMDRLYPRVRVGTPVTIVGTYER